MTAADIGNPCFSKGHPADGTIYRLDDFRRNATTILARHFLHRRLTLLNPDCANLGPEGDLDEARLRFALAVPNTLAIRGQPRVDGGQAEILSISREVDTVDVAFKNRDVAVVIQFSERQDRTTARSQE